MRIRRLPIIVEIDETKRLDWALGAGTRLNPGTHALELEAGAGGFSLSADLAITSRVFNPTSVKKFVGFDVDIKNAYDTDLQVEVTGANYRLNDGTTDLYWDGGAWSAAGASDWNSEADIANNIATFPVADCKIQVIINPFTVDINATPQILEIRILMESTLEELEDLVWRSLIPLMRAEIRPITDHPILFAGGTTIDLATIHPLETPYNIAGIDSVFNYGTDPKGQIDILDSYDSGTKIITLNQSLPASTKVWIKVIFEPEVVVTTSQEYDELAKVPVIVFRDINAVNSATVGAACHVRNKDQHTAVGVSMKHIDVDMSIECVTDKQKDLQRLSQEIDRFFEEFALLRSTGLDRDYSMVLSQEYDGATIPSQSELHTSRFRARIAKALFFDRAEEDVFTIERFTLQGDMNASIS